MTRYDNKLYYSSAQYDETVREPETITRPNKLSADKKAIREKIAGCRIQLRFAGPGVPQSVLDKTKKDLAKFERQLANMPSTKTHKIKKTYKKMSMDKIKQYALNQIEVYKRQNADYIVAEDIAHQLNVKPHFVHQVFRQLNVEGILSQPIHHAPHDSSRDPWGYGNLSGWRADLYEIIYRDEEEVE